MSTSLKVESAPAQIRFWPLYSSLGFHKHRRRCKTEFRYCIASPNSTRTQDGDCCWICCRKCTGCLCRLVTQGGETGWLAKGQCALRSKIVPSKLRLVQIAWWGWSVQIRLAGPN